MLAPRAPMVEAVTMDKTDSVKAVYKRLLVEDSTADGTAWSTILELRIKAGSSKKEHIISG